MDLKTFAVYKLRPICEKLAIYVKVLTFKWGTCRIILKKKQK